MVWNYRCVNSKNLCPKATDIDTDISTSQNDFLETNYSIQFNIFIDGEKKTWL